jgi:hypothetical protein
MAIAVEEKSKILDLIVEFRYSISTAPKIHRPI